MRKNMPSQTLFARPGPTTSGFANPFDISNFEDVCSLEIFADHKNSMQTFSKHFLRTSRSSNAWSLRRHSAPELSKNGPWPPRAERSRSDPMFILSWTMLGVGKLSYSVSCFLNLLFQSNAF